MNDDQYRILHGMVSFAGVTFIGCLPTFRSPFRSFPTDPVIRDRDGKLFVILSDGDTEPLPENVLPFLLPINPK